ncbi:MAG: metallophosphatase family protein [Rhodocyclaceae bacterium]|nr:metallophosphatase family protein [Rhodocyclaceae bacterium]
MRVALLGDVHANADALEAVLYSAAGERVDALLITGDLVGYYFYPGAVMELLSPWRTYAVRGNHEAMLSRCRNETGFLSEVSRRYGSGIQVALSELAVSALDALCDLPHPLSLELDARRILLCHGAPCDIDTYVYPDSDLATVDLQAAKEYDLVVTGHTHYPMHRAIGAKTFLVNPGSVGQPRNRQPGAHWALYDTDSGEVSFRRESYDYSRLQAEARRRHPELPYLADVLGRT